MSLDAIGIVSADINESVKFYNILGIQLKESGGEDHYEGATPSGVRIMVDSVELTKQLNPNWIKPTGNGVILCFKYDTPEKVDQLFLEIKSAGYTTITKPWDAFWGQRYASTKDPDGNQIDLFAEI